MANNKFKLMLEGHPYEIERRDGLMVVNGVEFSIEVRDAQILVSGTAHQVKLGNHQAEVDGISYPFEALGLEDAKPGPVRRKGAGAVEEAGAIVAIMPGLILKLLKQEGDAVKVGETVIILEAMKMQNELHARTAGTIRQMKVKQGDNVEMRQVLCVIE